MADFKMISESMKQFFKTSLGMSDSELDRLSPGYSRLFSAFGELMRWRIIAEVTESTYCTHGCRVGDRIVFSGHAIDTAESSCPLCLGALAPLLDKMHIMWDRIIDGRDPNELWVRYSQCYDAGLNHGGLGRVIFRVYAIRK